MEILRICPEEHIPINNYVIKHLILLKIQNRTDITVNVLYWFWNFFDKRTCGANTSGCVIENKTILAGGLHKPIIRKFENQKVHSSFWDNIWGTDLADMQLINKFNKRICFSLYVLCIVNMPGLFLWRIKKILQL